MYSKKLYAGWADMDFNSHMKNTAYLDKAVDVRQMFLIENGFPIEEFLRLQIGPVMMKDEVEYFKEVGLQPRPYELRVTWELKSTSSLAYRSTLQNRPALGPANLGRMATTRVCYQSLCTFIR